MDVDYLVVGGGLTGATIARTLKDKGEDVLVVERRPRIGGNCHDQVHLPSGILYHTYGPHLFRTDKKEVWDYVQRFGDFYKYEHEVKTLVDEEYENWPISHSYLKKNNIKLIFPFPCCSAPANFEEACLQMMPQEVYLKFVKYYSEKQWGVKATELSPALAGRFDVREDDDPRLKKEKYQGLPAEGYTNLITKMLEGIPVLLNFDYLQHKHSIGFKHKLFYTGSIDEFYGFQLGRLSYRSQRRDHFYYPDEHYHQPFPVVNEPRRDITHVRTVEWKHFLSNLPLSSGYNGSLVTVETPSSATTLDEREYPFPDEKNKNLYLEYSLLAQAVDENVVFAGRLAEYKYKDMDTCVQDALELVETII